MSEHRYTLRALAGDYLRSVAGLGFALAVLAALGFDAGIAAWLLLGLAALCALLAARTALRQTTVLATDDQGLVQRHAGLPLVATRIPWDDVTEVRLRFFPTNRDRSQGWMQLVLRGGGRRMVIDSTIDGFRDIAARALDSAVQRNLPLSVATQENLAAMGLRRPVGRGEAKEPDDSHPAR